ncbi:GPI inositol-deacylase [Archangium gephyra]|uniref:esterase/lipase family protein n=1 Tax=Archangium gephyra TaxID=48 RepID=UPI0035D48FE7
MRVWRAALALVAAAALGACGPMETGAPVELAPAEYVELAPSAPEMLGLGPQASPVGDAAQEAELERIVSSQAVSTHYILFIRGLDPYFNRAAYDNGNVPQACDAYWSSALQFFTNRGWGSQLRTIGIYSRQSGCYVNLANVVPNQSSTLSLMQGSSPFTNETSIGALGHRLAWWIYNNYTSKGLTVSLVGHSMGGLVARTAVGGASKRLSGFPPPLLVKGMVLLGTPNNGASSSYLGGLTGCTTQCAQMNSGSTFLNSLNNAWDTGNSGVSYRLNLIGSNDYVVGDVRSGAYGGTGTSLYFISPAYDHGNILTDQGTTSDASIGYWTDRTQAYTLNPPKYQGQPRSLTWTYNWATSQ